MNWTEFGRTLLSSLPMQLRTLAIVGAATGGSLSAVCSLFRPVLEPAVKGILNIYGFNQWDWLFLGIAVCAPLRFLWYRTSKIAFASRSFDHTIDTISSVMDKAKMPKSQRMLVWNNIVHGLAKQAQLGGDTNLTQAALDSAQQDLHALSSDSSRI